VRFDECLLVPSSLPFDSVVALVFFCVTACQFAELFGDIISWRSAGEAVDGPLHDLE